MKLVREVSHSIWSASLAEELGLSQDIQNVILYHHKSELFGRGKCKNRKCAQ